MRTATKVFSVFSIIKFVIIGIFIFYIVNVIKNQGTEFNFEQLVEMLEELCEQYDKNIDIEKYTVIFQKLFNIIFDYTLVFIIIEVGVNILTICVASKASKIFMVLLGFVKILLLWQLLSGLFTLLSAFTEPQRDNDNVYNNYNNNYNYNNNPYAYTNRISTNSNDINSYVVNNGHNQLYKSSWKPTGIVPQRSYSHSRPNLSTICIFLIVVGVVFIFLGFVVSYWCFIPAVFLILVGVTNNKGQIFMKRCDKIIKKGMTYDEVIYIMEGFTPHSSGYTHDGCYCLDYMKGNKKRDYEQRRFYFDQNGILVDIGVAYHRTYYR